MGKFRIDGRIYEATTPEEAYRKHDEQTKLPVWSGALQQFNQGLTLGGADDFTALLEAARGGNYSESMKIQEAQRNRFQREHPWISGTATAVGAVAPVAASLFLAPETGGMSTAAAGARGLQLSRIAFGGGGGQARTGFEAIKEGARVGVPIGTVAGTLSAPEDQRLMGAIEGGTLGAVVGGGTGYGSFKLPQAIEAGKTFIRRFRGSSTAPTGAAPTGAAPTGAAPTGAAPTVAAPTVAAPTGAATADEIKVLRAMEASGVSPEAALARLIEARRLGVPLGVIDVGGTQTQRLGRSVRTLPGEGSNIVETALAERAASQPSRVVRWLERALGTRATGRGEAVLDDLLTQARNQSGPYYRQLGNLPEITDPTVINQFRLPAIRNIIQNAEEASIAWGRPVNPMYRANGSLARNPTFRDVDLINQNIHEMLRPSYSINPRPVAGAPVATRGEREMASGVRRELVGAADLAPGGQTYYNARAGYAGPSEAREFYESGLRFPKESVTDVNAILENATGPQSKWYRRGQIEALRTNINAMPDLLSQPNVLRSFWGNPGSRAKLEVSVPNVRTRRADLNARLRMENEAAKTSNFVRSGSQTPDKVAEALDAVTPVDIIEGVSSPVKTTIKGMWNSISGAVGKETRTNIARHLTNFDNPDQIIVFLRRLQELQSRGRLNAQSIDAAASASTIFNQVRD